MDKDIYYKKRDNTFYKEKTKEEILSIIDYNNPATFLPFLEVLDYPYIEFEWNLMLENKNKKPNFGRYIALMRLASFRAFSYQDSDTFKRKEKTT